MRESAQRNQRGWRAQHWLQRLDQRIKVALGRPALLDWFEAALQFVLIVAVGTWFFDSYEAVRPRHSGDSLEWAKNGYKSFFPDIFLGTRPPLVPLVHRLFAFDETKVVWFQATLKVLASAYLAHQLAHFFQRRWLRLTAFALLLGFLISDPNAWEFTIRSESIAHSTLCLLLGALFLYLRRLRSGEKLLGAAAWLLLFALFYVAARDSAIYVLLGMAVATVALLGTTTSPNLAWATTAGRATVKPSATRSRKRLLTLLAVACALTGIALGAQKLALEADRHHQPLLNIILRDAMQDDTMRAFLRDEAGMPVTPELRRLRGRLASADRWAISRDKAVVDWVDEQGPAALRDYLLSDPIRTLIQTSGHYRRIVQRDHQEEYLAKPAREELRRFGQFLHSAFPSQHWPRITWSVLGVLAIVAFLLRRKTASGTLWGFTIFAVLASGGIALIAVHGDAIEVYRHAASSALFLHLAMITATVALLFDVVAATRWLSRRKAALHRPAADTTPPRTLPKPALPTMAFALLAIVVLSSSALAQQKKTSSLRTSQATASARPPQETLETLRDGELFQPRFCLEPGQKVLFDFSKGSGFGRVLLLHGLEPQPYHYRVRVGVGSKKRRTNRVGSIRNARRAHWNKWISVRGKANQTRVFARKGRGRRLVLVGGKRRSCFAELIFD